MFNKCKKISTFADKQKDIYNSVVDKDKLFALYAAKQRSSDTISTLFTVQLLDGTDLVITEIYSKTYKSMASIATLLIGINSQYYKDNGIKHICFRFNSEKSMNDMFGLIQRSAFAIRQGTTIPKFSYGKADQVHITYNGESIDPEYGIGILFSDITDAIDNAAKEQLRA